MKRTAIMYSILLVVALGAAWVSWTWEDDESRQTGVLLADLDEKSWQEIRYEEKDYRVVLTRKNDDAGEYVWVESLRETEGEESKSLSFTAGTSVEPVVSNLAPFMASREIEASDELLEEFGLKPAQAKLVLKGSKTYEFEVGKEGYGHRDFYVRDVGTSKVYLVSGAALRPLVRAEERLPERRLVETESWDIEKIEIGEPAKVFEHRNREDRTASFWARAGSEDRETSAQAWIDKFLRMRSTSSIAKAPEGLESALKVRVHAGKKVSDIELFRHAGEKESWYAKSTLTRGLVELPMALASDLVQDLKTLEEPVQ